MNSNLANHSVKQFFRCSSGSWRSVFKWCSTMSSPSKYASLPKVCSISRVCVCVWTGQTSTKKEHWPSSIQPLWSVWFLK